MDTIKLNNIFGYSVKAVPGLEINGLGKLNRPIKEKIIFITRQLELKIPLKRFVINVEIEGEVTSEVASKLEYNILLVYWSLADVIESDIESYSALGSVSPSGVVTLVNGKPNKTCDLLTFKELSV